MNYGEALAAGKIMPEVERALEEGRNERPMETRIPTDAEYRQREASELQARLAEVERGTLLERREARDEWAQALTKPALIRERACWLIDGSYGRGAYDAVRSWSKRMNRVAALAILLAALEWRCPNEYARRAYKALSKAQQDAVDAELRDVIASYLDALEREA